jgi:hypothetical protein
VNGHVERSELFSFCCMEVAKTEPPNEKTEYRRTGTWLQIERIAPMIRPWR